MQVVINIFYNAALILIIGFSFSIIYYASRFFHLAHAAIFTFSAYFAFLFSKQLGLNLWFAVPFSVILSTVLGVLTEILIYKKLRKQSASPLILLITSLGLYVVFQNIISLLWGDDIKSIRIHDIIVGHEIFNANITSIQLFTIVISIILLFTSILFLKFSKLGKKIRAVSENEELSGLFGINADKIIVISFAIGSSLIAIAGILVAFDLDMTPTMGFKFLLYGIVAMIIGGVGSNWGLVGGAFLLATAQHLGAYYIDSKWMDAIAYFILILFLIWKPLGFSGKRLKKIEI